MADFTTDTDQQQVPQPPKKLKVSEFAAKVKVKYPEYKDLADDVLVDKIIAKYPQYKTQVDIPVKKNESQPTPSNVLDGQSPVQETPKKFKASVSFPELDNQSQPVAETDPIALAKQADALGKETVDINTGSGTGMYGGSGVQALPKSESVNKANEIYSNLKELGYDGKELAKDMADIPDFVFNQKGFTKDELLDDYKNNKPLYARKVATATWQPLLMNQLKEAQNNPDLKHDAYIASEDLGTALNNINIDGDYTSQRDVLQRVTNIANKFGGDNKDKILRNLGVDISYIYGKAASDPNFIMQNAGSNLNNLQAVATNYLQDIHPEELRKYTAAFLKDEDIKDNDSAKLAKEESAKRLEEIGMQLSKSYLQEKLNPIQKEYQPLWDKSQKEGLSPDELDRAKQLEQIGAPYREQLNNISEDEKALGEKYPTASAYQAYNFAQELVGQRQNWLEHLLAKTGEGTSNTASGIYDFVAEPFRSEKDSQLRQAGILGEGIENRTSTYVSGIGGKPELSPELKAEVDKIKNDNTLSQSEKLKATTNLLVKRNGEWYTNDKESNLSIKSLGYGITDLAAGLVPFMGLEMLTGGGATAGAVRKFTSTFVSAAATSFEDSYREGIEKGVKNPYAYATRVTAINSAAIAGAGTPDKIRAIFSKQKTPIGDLVMKMTDSEIEAALKEAPKALKSFKGTLDAAKSKLVGAGKTALSSFGEAAKINASMSAGKIANDAISGELKTPVDYAKDFALETLKFGLFSLGGKVATKLVKPTDIGLANLYDAANNKDAILSHLDERVKDGTISQTDATEIRSNVEEAAKIVNKSPFFKSLNDKAKREYLYNALVEKKNKEAAAGLPEKQAEKYDINAEAAKYKNAYLVEPKSPEQLEKRKAQLEKSLVPEKDAEGKNIEIPQAEIVAAKAEMQAIDDILADHKKANEAGVVIEAPTKINEPIQIGTNAAIEKAKEGGVEVQQPMNIPDAITPKEVSLTKEEQDAVDVISKADFNTEDGKRVKIWTDIISDPNATIENKKQALKELGEQLADKNSETETGLALGKAADAIYNLNDANGVKVEPLKIEVNEEPQVEVPKSTEEGSITDEGVDKESGAAKEGEGQVGEGDKIDGGEEWTSVRKAKLKEIAGVKEMFEKRVPKGWKQVYSSALENLAKMYPKKSVYDAMRARVNEFVAKVNSNELFNPTSEDIAVFNLFRSETEKRINNIEGIDSDNDIVRQAALAEFSPLQEDLRNVARVTNPNGEAGRAFGMLQSEINTNDGLKIRRMELLKANGGKKLTEQDEIFVSEQWEKEKELMKQEQEIRTKSMQEEFDKKVSDLQKAYEEKLKSASTSSKSTKEKTLSQKGKDVADRIRALKKPKGSTNIDFTLGTWDIAIEGIAKLVEGGATVSEAIIKMIDDGIIAFKESKDKDDFENYFAASLGERITKEDALSKIAEFAKDNDLSDINNEMVGKNLIRDYVESHIGEVDQSELLDTAAKDLKSVLPNVDKKTLIEAYLKENEFKQSTKKDLEGGLAEAKKQLKSIAKLTEDIEDLDNLKEIRKRSFPNERTKSEYEKKLFEEKTEKLKKLIIARNDFNKKERDSQKKRDKLAELDANIERAKNDRDLIKTHRNKTVSEIDEEISAKQKELKKAINDNTSEERVQTKKLAQEKENTIKKIKEFQQKLEDGEFDEPIPVKLKKQDAELIRLKKQQSIIEEAYRKKQHEVHEKNKTGLERAADFARSMYVAILIGAPKTLVKVGSMSVMRPLSEVATKATLGKVFNAFFPNMSKAALRGGESSSIRSIQKGAEAYFRQMGDKKMEALYEKANKEYDAATEAYNKYKSSGSPDLKKLEQLKNNMNDKLIKVQGSFIYKFIGGSSIKDVMKALVNRSNEIEKQFGKVEGESIKDGNWLDKINYVMGFIGRSHSALKTFSGRFSFAAGFMARLEGAVKNGEDISNPDKVLEIAHESYLDWERGKYQQSNQVSDLWNKLTNHISEGEVGTPREGTSKVMAALLRTEVAITRVPVNILHEAVMEYTLGAFKAAILANREVSKIKGQLKTEGLMPNEPEFKAALKERISQMDETQAATIARCFRKGGLGVGLYALALITGAMHFGIFPHMGQKKKKDEEDLGVDELNPGQVMLGDKKFGEVTSGVIEHIPALWTTFMGVGMAQAYNDEIKKGKTTKEAVAKSIYTHLKIVEGGIPQSKIISPTRVAETIYQSVKKKMTDAGILDKVESKGGKHSKNTKR